VSAGGEHLLPLDWAGLHRPAGDPGRGPGTGRYRHPGPAGDGDRGPRWGPQDVAGGLTGPGLRGRGVLWRLALRGSRALAQEPERDEPGLRRPRPSSGVAAGASLPVLHASDPHRAVSGARREGEGPPRALPPTWGEPEHGPREAYCCCDGDDHQGVSSGRDPDLEPARADLLRLS